jgi:carbonic anhydrase
MKGLLNPSALETMPDVRGWLEHSQEARRALEAAGIDPKSPEALELVTKLNIRLQIDHLRSHPPVRAAVRAGSLRLHGWYYRIDTGSVEAWDVDSSRWVPVHHAYAPLGAAHENTVGAAFS